MTREEREEAIKHIKDIICENNTVKHSDIVVFEEEKEALRRVIKALSQEPNRDMEEIAEIMKSDADAETKCKMISNILTAKPHYFELSQEPCDDMISLKYRLIDLANAIESDDSSYWTNKRISSALRNISSIVETSVTSRNRKGHWIIKDRYYHDTITAECSECGREVEIPTCMSELMYKGCPYCLAELESEYDSKTVDA